MAAVMIPAIGISPTETVQVNVTNMAPLPLAGGLAPTCQSVILFYYTPSNSPGSLTPFAQMTFSVVSGQTFSFAAPYASTPGTGGRQMIRPAINLATQNGVVENGIVTSSPICILVTSVETFDTTNGVSHSVVNPPPVTQTPDSSTQARAAVTFPR